MSDGKIRQKIHSFFVSFGKYQDVPNICKERVNHCEFPKKYIQPYSQRGICI